MSKLSDSKVAAVTSQNYTGVATAGQTVIIPGFNWRTVWTGQALYISGVKQAPNSYAVNSIGGGLSSQITLSEALVGGEAIDFTALDISAVPSLQGIVDTLALQPTQITNAGFGVWSNGTLESAVSSINLITNGEFETDLAGWTAGNSATLTRDTTTSANGSACLKVTNGAASAGYGNFPTSTTIGRVYKVVCYAKSGNGVNGANICVGTTVGGYDIGYAVTASPSWTKLEIVFEAIGTITHINPQNGPTNGLICYYDSITLYDMGANLVTNGTFNANATGWTNYNNTIGTTTGGINGNCAVVTGSSGAGAYQQIAGLAVGKLYRLSGWMKNGSVSGPILQLGTAMGTMDLVIIGAATVLNLTSWTYYSALFEATTSSVYCFLGNQLNGTTLFDSIALTEVTVGCVDYNTKALDLWTKDPTAVCFRETINTKSGAYYALRVYNGAVYWSDGGRAAKPEFYSKYAGRAAAIGMLVRCSSANKARIGITDSAGTTWSSYHSGGGAYEWLEVTRTPGAGITSFNVVVDSGTGTEAQFSQPQLMFGTSVGAGNFVPIPGEYIPFEQTLLSKLLNGTGKSAASITTVPIQKDFEGRLPKGLKAVDMTLGIMDSSASYQYVVLADSNLTDELVAKSLITSTTGYGSGRYRISNDAYRYRNGAGGTNTCLITLFVNGAQL